MVASGGMTNAECVLCAQCVDACPKDVLALRFTHG
jgi:NAD-dependent dihydropyrimidine dehydrogenase PreA subunit